MGEGRRICPNLAVYLARFSPLLIEEGTISEQSAFIFIEEDDLL